MKKPAMTSCNGLPRWFENTKVKTWNVKILCAPNDLKLDKFVSIVFRFECCRKKLLIFCCFLCESCLSVVIKDELTTQFKRWFVGSLEKNIQDTFSFLFVKKVKQQSRGKIYNALYQPRVFFSFLLYLLIDLSNSKQAIQVFSFCFEQFVLPVQTDKFCTFSFRILFLGVWLPVQLACYKSSKFPKGAGNPKRSSSMRRVADRLTG